MNSLTQEEKTRIWIPRIMFNNTDDENETVVDAKAKVAVLRKVRERAPGNHAFRKVGRVRLPIFGCGKKRRRTNFAHLGF